MATREIERAGTSLSINRMTEHDLLEVVEIEELSGISVWGWDAYHKELQSPQEVIMLVARPDQSIENRASLIAGFIVSRMVAGDLYINKVWGGPGISGRGIAGPHPR